MLQWGLVMKLEWCQAKWRQKAPCPVGADPAQNLESWTEPPYFFNFSVTWHSALVQCLQEKKWYTILRSAWARGVDVSVFLLFLCGDCCYDNKKLKISYPVKPVFSAKPAPVNLWNILGLHRLHPRSDFLKNTPNCFFMVSCSASFYDMGSKPA